MTRKPKTFPAVFQGLEAGLRMFRWVVVVLLLLFCFSGIDKVEPGNVGLLFRFGKLQGATRADQIKDPGLVLALPYPIDQVVQVRVKGEGEVVVEEAWHELGETPTTDMIDPVLEGYCLTGDQNIIQAKLVIKYKITDPIAYQLSVTETDGESDRDAILRDVVLAALTQTVAGWRVDHLLNKQRPHGQIGDAAGVLPEAFGKPLQPQITNATESLPKMAGEPLQIPVMEAMESLSETVKGRAQERLDALAGSDGFPGCGLEIRAVEFREIHAPRHVKADFDRVQSEVIDARTKMQRAELFAAQTIPRAEARHNEMVQQAKAYQSMLIGQALAEVEAFRKLYIEYRKSPKLIWQQMYSETLEEILGRVGRRVFLPPNTQPILPGESQP